MKDFIETVEEYFTEETINKYNIIDRCKIKSITYDPDKFAWDIMIDGIPNINFERDLGQKLQNYWIEVKEDLMYRNADEEPLSEDEGILLKDLDYESDTNTYWLRSGIYVGYKDMYGGFSVMINNEPYDILPGEEEVEVNVIPKYEIRELHDFIDGRTKVTIRKVIPVEDY